MASNKMSSQLYANLQRTMHVSIFQSSTSNACTLQGLQGCPCHVDKLAFVQITFTLCSLTGWFAEGCVLYASELLLQPAVVASISNRADTTYNFQDSLVFIVFIIQSISDMTVVDFTIQYSNACDSSTYNKQLRICFH